MSSSSANCFHITTSNLRSGASLSPSLLDDVGHRHALVQDTQLAVRVRCWAGWVNFYSNGGILEKEIQQNKNDYEWDWEVELNLLRGTWRFLHTSTSCEHRPPSTQCTCFKGSRIFFFKISFASIGRTTCCRRGCFPSFWILHIPSQHPPNAPRSPVISMK